jgi:ABC-2 type transport system permease protein
VSTESVPAQASLGQPMQGPSALSGDFRRFLLLTRVLAFQDFKLRFFGSALGYFWQLARPLMLFGVLYLVFTEFIRVGGNAKYYAVVLLADVVMFTFFSEVTFGAVGSVLDRENLVRKLRFPRLVVPLATVLTGLFNLGLNFIAVFIFALASGVPVRWTWLLLPVMLLILAIFAAGIAMLLSALFPRIRDLRPIWEVTLQILFYGSPVLYTIEVVSNKHPALAHWLMVNPLAAVFEQVRHSVIDSSAPTAAAAIGGGWRLLIPAGIVVGTVILGFYVFNREAPKVAEML